MAMKKIAIGALLVIIFSGISVPFFASGSPATYKNVSNNGAVKAVSVNLYWDEGCTSNVDSISWGLLQPGMTVNKTIYISNNHPTRSVKLNMATENWTPEVANGPITVTWNRENQVLPAGVVIEAIMTLSVSPNIVENFTNFSFDMAIIGTGQ